MLFRYKAHPNKIDQQNVMPNNKKPLNLAVDLAKDLKFAGTRQNTKSGWTNNIAVKNTNTASTYSSTARFSKTSSSYHQYTA